AIFRRRTSASAITRCLTRFPRLRALRTRHLFGFSFSSEKRSMFFLFRFLGRSARRLRPALAGLACGFHLNNKFRRHVVVQLNGDLMLAGIFDWSLQSALVSINLFALSVFQP